MPTATATALETADAFVRAYADADYETVQSLLHPAVRYREITPNQLIEATGPGAILEEERDFLARRGPQETLELQVSAVGDRVAARTRWRLLGQDEPWVVDWCQYITVEDGRVTALDGVCSGPMPER
jgi:ketosteroid isomerase-like protein